VGVGVLLHADGRVLGGEPGEGLRELVVVGLAVCLDGDRQQRLGQRPRVEGGAAGVPGEGASGLG